MDTLKKVLLVTYHSDSGATVEVYGLVLEGDYSFGMHSLEYGSYELLDSNSEQVLGHYTYIPGRDHALSKLSF